MHMYVHNSTIIIMLMGQNVAFHSSSWPGLDNLFRVGMREYVFIFELELV